MGFAEVLAVVVPAFAIVALGYWIGGRRRIDLGTLTEVVVYIGGPALVFHSLYSGTIAYGEVGILAGGVLTIVLGVGALVFVGSRIVGRPAGVLYLPCMFMNAGNMLLPLSLFAFGEEGLARAVIIFATMTLLQSTLGVLIASGRPDPIEALRLPYIYAVVAAFGCRASQLEVPTALLRGIGLLADLAVPLMLLALGLRLRTVVITSWRRPAVATLARVGGGYAVALVLVACVPMPPITRSVLLLTSVMPAAVVNFVFAEKYGNESGDVATVVFLSTVVSLVTTPLVLAFGI